MHTLASVNNGCRSYKFLISLLLLTLVVCGTGPRGYSLVVTQHNGHFPTALEYTAHLHSPHYAAPVDPESNPAGTRLTSKELAELFKMHLRKMGIQVTGVDALDAGLIVTYQPMGPGTGIFLLKEVMRILQLLLLQPFREVELVTLIAVSPQENRIRTKMIRVQDYLDWWNGRIDSTAFFAGWL
ncbi:hypothetical protein SY88_16125 [Clostridiales bacterium PH28_bin88]|nr:hypothetical protein SY88_16125 [Clostridiales bacterium PH28_bin88]